MALSYSLNWYIVIQGALSEQIHYMHAMQRLLEDLVPTLGKHAHRKPVNDTHIANDSSLLSMPFISKDSYCTYSAIDGQSQSKFRNLLNMRGKICSSALAKVSIQLSLSLLHAATASRFLNFWASRPKANQHLISNSICSSTTMWLWSPCPGLVRPRGSFTTRGLQGLQTCISGLLLDCYLMGHDH